MRALVTLFTFFFTIIAHADGEGFVMRRGLTMPLEDQAANENGLKVMWWNVGCSSTRRLKTLSDVDRVSVDPVNQWTNLRELVESERLIPDVLILGEYCPSAFDDPTYRTIISKYEFKYRLDKANPLFKIRNGLRVFSKIEIKDVEESVLDTQAFVDSDLMQTCDEETRTKNPKSFGLYTKFEEDIKKYWDRPKISFTVEHRGRKYKIAPIHLANPWPILYDCLGFWKMPGVIKRDETNANFIQAEQIVETFVDEESTILIGDFNAPKKILGSGSKSYELLSEYFGPSVIQSEQFTFDDPRRNFPAYSIDHAFVSSDLNVKKGVVLPFAGSDHLPIYLVVD